MRVDPGFTLIESLTVLAVLLVLVAIAVPSFQTLLLESRMTSAVNALIHAVHLARVTSHQQVRNVVICRSADGSGCAPGGNWSSGWIVFVNGDSDDPPVADFGERVLHNTQPPAVASILSNRAAFVLRPMGRRATNGTVTFCDRRGPAAARAVVISYTGRPRLTTRTSGGRPLTCPA
jgi:type IV fimbrial biogenesis protein FimT